MALIVAHISDSLVRRHEGPLPARVTDWLQESEKSTHAFQSAGTALLVRAPASKEKAFRERLKDLGYLPSQTTSVRRY